MVGRKGRTSFDAWLVTAFASRKKVTNAMLAATTRHVFERSSETHQTSHKQIDQNDLHRQMAKHWPIYVSLGLIAWAAALQYHMHTVRQTDAYKEKFKDAKPASLGKLVLGPIFSKKDD